MKRLWIFLAGLVVVGALSSCAVHVDGETIYVCDVTCVAVSGGGSW